MGGESQIVYLRDTIISGGLGVLPQENFFDFEHWEVTSGAFIDQKLSSYQL